MAEDEYPPTATSRSARIATTSARSSTTRRRRSSTSAAHRSIRASSLPPGRGLSGAISSTSRSRRRLASEVGLKPPLSNAGEGQRLLLSPDSGGGSTAAALFWGGSAVHLQDGRRSSPSLKAAPRPVPWCRRRLATA